MSSTTRSGREYKGEGKVSHVPSAGHTQGHVVSAAHVLQGHVVSAAHVQQEGHVDPVFGNGQVGAIVTGNYTNVVTSAGDGVTASAGGYDPLSIGSGAQDGIIIESEEDESEDEVLLHPAQPAIYMMRELNRETGEWTDIYVRGMQMDARRAASSTHTKEWLGQERIQLDSPSSIVMSLTGGTKQMRLGNVSDPASEISVAEWSKWSASLFRDWMILFYRMVAAPKEILTNLRILREENLRTRITYFQKKLLSLTREVWPPDRRASRSKYL